MTIPDTVTIPEGVTWQLTAKLGFVGHELEQRHAMHATSGLFDDARSHAEYSVGQSLLMLCMILEDVDQPVALAGTGIAHFDRRVIDAQFPAVADRLTYWALDMGPIRRLAEGTGHTDLCLPAPVDGIAHRAEADVRRAQAEYRQWVRVFGWANTGDVLGIEVA